MIEKAINKIVVASVIVVQLVCLWMLHTISRLAEHAYRVMIPGLDLPKCTEVAMHTVFIIPAIGLACVAVLAFASYRYVSTSVRTCILLVLLCVELVLLLTMCWAYLLPFGYMSPTH